MIQVILLASSLSAGFVNAAGPGASVDDTMKAEWKKIAPKKGYFSPQRSMYFPASWPYDGKTLGTYFYADSFDPERGISDGQIRATVWAKAVVDRSSGRVLKVTKLAGEVKEIGIQGVRPLYKDEVAVVKLGDISSRTAPITSDADKKRIRDYYCHWRTVDGVIAAEIEPHEKNFFQWLNCAAWKAPPTH